MMKFLRKYRNHIFLCTIAFFLVSVFLGFGGNFFSKGSPYDTVAEVNGKKIPLHLFESHFYRAMDQVQPGTTLDDAAKKQKKDEVLRDLIQGVVFEEQSKKYGIKVPDQQVVNSLAGVPAFQTEGRFDPALYGRALATQLHSTPKQFEEEQRRSIAFFKLRWLIQSVIKVTDKEAELAYAMQHQGDMRAYPKEAATFHEQLWQEKTLFAFNQWFQQIGSKTRVKTHLDVIEGRR